MTPHFFPEKDVLVLFS